MLVLNRACQLSHRTIVSAIRVLCASRIRANDPSSCPSKSECPVQKVSLNPLGGGDDMMHDVSLYSPGALGHRHLLVLAVAIRQSLSCGKVEYFFSENVHTIH